MIEIAPWNGDERARSMKRNAKRQFHVVPRIFGDDHLFGWAGIAMQYGIANYWEFAERPRSVVRTTHVDAYNPDEFDQCIANWRVRGWHMVGSHSSTRFSAHRATRTDAWTAADLRGLLSAPIPAHNRTLGGAWSRRIRRTPCYWRRGWKPCFAISLR